MANRIKGMTQVLSNLNRELDKVLDNGLIGLIKCAIQVRRDMDTSPPLIPVDFGNLRQSFFIVSRKGVKDGSSPSFKGNNEGELSSDHAAILSEASSLVQNTLRPLVILGFSANYALPVHEMTDPGIIWSRPGSGPRFFHEALMKNVPNYIGIIGLETKIKG